MENVLAVTFLIPPKFFVLASAIFCFNFYVFSSFGRMKQTREMLKFFEKNFSHHIFFEAMNFYEKFFVPIFTFTLHIGRWMCYMWKWMEK